MFTYKPFKDYPKCPNHGIPLIHVKNCCWYCDHGREMWCVHGEDESINKDCKKCSKMKGKVTKEPKKDPRIIKLLKYLRMV